MSRLGFVAVALLAASQAALAQQAPGAGGQLQQIPPAPTAPKAAPVLQLERQAVRLDTGPAGAKVRVDALHLTGQSLFPEAALIAASGFVPGSELSLAELRAIAAKIAGFYNKRGYFLAQAYVPAQDIKGGAVTIAVVEGRYGKISLNNSAHLSNRVARGRLRGLDSGDIVASAPLERRLLLLSDLPGVAVSSTLAPGAAVGTSDLAVDLTPGRRIDGSVEADNAGNRYTGAYRFGGTVNFNNPTGNGDLFSLRILASTSGLAYGRAAYQAPIGDLTLGVAYSHFRYDLGREFKSLEAHGTADIASVYASYPVIRSRNANLYALAGADAKWFNDKVDVVPSQSDRKSQVLTLGFAADSHDGFGGGGWNGASAGVSLGNLDIESPAERAADALTARSDGGFGKANFSLWRLQTISGRLSLYGAVRGQIAFDNLDSSEKMELGGAYGVRAYPEGESYGDEGYIATIEARLALNQWARRMPGRLQLIGFIDAGEIRYAHNPWFAGSNHAHRSAIGTGLVWETPSSFIVKATYAHKLGGADATSGPDKSGRFWFQVIKFF